MVEQELNVGIIIEHKDKTTNELYSHDGIYVVISTKGRMKINDIWVDSVFYISFKDYEEENEEPTIYTREKSNFLNEFVKKVN